MDHAGRLDRLRVALPGLEVDALVVTDLINVRYLTGFTGSNAVVVVTAPHPAGDAPALLITDGRYRDQAAAEIDAAGVDVHLRIERTNVDGVIAEAVAGCARVGLEAIAVTWAAQRRYADRFTGSELVPLTDAVEQLRAVKDAGEIDRMARAAEIADAALEQCLGKLRTRPTEREFALALEVAMRRMGADGPSFETIVASGPNGALPHARPGHRRIEPGDLVVLDFGALLDGYHSDMTRTLCVGRASPDQRRHHDVVARAQAAGVAAVRAGVAAGDIDAATRAVIDDAGWGEQFTHGTGHGVGLRIHEHPFLSRGAEPVLAEGFVVTVEPGVYLPGHGGVRVEDTVVVGPDGCRSLTRFPRELEV